MKFEGEQPRFPVLSRSAVARQRPAQGDLEDEHLREVGGYSSLRTCVSDSTSIRSASE